MMPETDKEKLAAFQQELREKLTELHRVRDEVETRIVQLAVIMREAETRLKGLEPQQS